MVYYIILMLMRFFLLEVLVFFEDRVSCLFFVVR